jgi:hypothetical protein
LLLSEFFSSSLPYTQQLSSKSIIQHIPHYTIYIFSFLPISLFSLLLLSFVVSYFLFLVLSGLRYFPMAAVREYTEIGNKGMTDSPLSTRMVVA